MSQTEQVSTMQPEIQGWFARAWDSDMAYSLRHSPAISPREMPINAASSTAINPINSDRRMP